MTADSLHDSARPFAVVCAACGLALVMRSTVRVAALIEAETRYGWLITSGGDLCHECYDHKGVTL